MNIQIIHKKLIFTNFFVKKIHIVVYFQHIEIENKKKPIKRSAFNK